jgi:hypothetical protein
MCIWVSVPENVGYVGYMSRSWGEVLISGGAKNRLGIVLRPGDIECED